MTKHTTPDTIAPLRLESARLQFREWQLSDLSDLIEGLDNLDVAKWLAFVPHPFTQKEGEGWIRHCIALSAMVENRCDYEFAIVHKTRQKVIGGMSITRISRQHGTAGGGIWINSCYQGQGLGSEAFGARIRFAFEELDLRRLENGFFKGNEASLAMQQRFGYKLEGEKRKAFRCMADGILKDECITGLLREEWIRGATTGAADSGKGSVI
jgi:RimJ/RimL family protein N-acetyltransferase